MQKGLKPAYVIAIEQTATVRGEVLDQVREWRLDFYKLLLSDKHQGTDYRDGSRNDWIASQDVLNHLDNLQNILSGEALP